MNLLRLSMGFFGTLMLGAIGLFLMMLDVPPAWTDIQPATVNVHFLGQFMIGMALIMFSLTFWIPRQKR